MRPVKAAIAPPDPEENAFALGLLAKFDGGFGVAHRLAVDFQDDVAPVQTGLVGIGVGTHFRDQGTMEAGGRFERLPGLRIQIGNAHAVERIGPG